MEDLGRVALDGYWLCSRVAGEIVAPEVIKGVDGVELGEDSGDVALRVGNRQ